MTPSYEDFAQKRVVLGVDSATKSGFAILRGKNDLIGSGCIHIKKHPEQIKEAIERAKRAAAGGPGVIVIAEEWGAIGHKIGVKAYATLCESWGLWRAFLADAGIRSSQIYRVHTARWRSAVIGKGSPKAMAKIIAKSRFKILVEDDNEAEAICIAIYGSSLR